MNHFIQWLESLPTEQLLPMFILARALAVIFPPFQGWPLDIVAERLWGWKIGLLWSECGVTLGALIAYSIGRAASKPALGKLTLLRRAQSWEASFGKSRWTAWVALRLISNPLFDGLCYVAGVLRVPKAMFLTTTMVGSAPSLGFFMWGVSHANGTWGTAIFVGAFVSLSLLVVARLLRGTEL